MVKDSQEQLIKLKRTVIGLSIFLIFAVEFYYYLRGILIFDIAASFLIALPGAIFIIEIAFRTLSKLQTQIQNEVKEKEEIIKRLEESEEKYRTTFEYTGTAMTIVEEDTTLSMVNSEFEKLSGYRKEEIEGKMSWTQFVHPEDLERMKKYHYARRRGEEVPKRYEFRFIDREGNLKNILINIDLISGTKKTVASLIDISWIRKLNNLLRAASDINELVVRERNPETILKTTCKKLSSVYPAVFALINNDGELRISAVGIEEKKVREIINQCPTISKALKGEINKFESESKCFKCLDKPLKYILSIPIVHEIQYGVITVYSSEFSDEEVNLLTRLSKNIAFAIHAQKTEEDKRKALEQLIINLKQFEYTADKMRNPLAVIMSSIELVNEIGKDKTLEIINEQAMKIQQELDELRREEIKTYNLINCK